ncbi:TPA: hypothetical protein U1324_000492 [Streptococcus suis]|uniref:Uncharacterized protein n=1 Tax=Streptococcus suis TaxID=1307 RepID=A0AAJ2PFJ0_STRSU|nr:hypothetical protein [Streptococcus suis]NQR49537.1 hypothetical protein [Streptococcus suis]HEL1749258.1 hypothetical protein [Streptococcus suis]HEL2319988.1 hypothetical protein [Streptococcus suis]HEL2326003.1 hypothetical protein [Streptococcus suis]
MRLKEINKIFQENVNNLRTDFKNDNISSQQEAQILDYGLSIQALEAIRTTSLIESEVKELKELNFPFNDNNDKEYVTSGHRMKLFFDINKRIKLKGEVIKDIVSKSYHSLNDNEKHLLISLPNRTSDFKDFSAITKDLNQIFKLLSVFEEFKEQDVILEDFDIGSDWFVLLLSSAAAVEIMARIITIAVKVSAQIHNTRVMKKGLETISLAEEEKQKMIQVSSEINQKLLSEYAKELLEVDEFNSEKITQLAKAIELTNDLVTQGLSFEIPKLASEEIRKNFPTFSEQNALDNTKLINPQELLDDTSSK